MLTVTYKENNKPTCTLNSSDKSSLSKGMFTEIFEKNIGG